jgi:hypothetical protein
VAIAAGEVEEDGEAEWFCWRWENCILAYLGDWNVTATGAALYANNNPNKRPILVAST